LGVRGPKPIFPVMPEEGMHEVRYANRRINVARILPNGFRERKLRSLADLWPSPSMN